MKQDITVTEMAEPALTDCHQAVQDHPRTKTIRLLQARMPQFKGNMQQYVRIHMIFLLLHMLISWMDSSVRCRSVPETLCFHA